MRLILFLFSILPLKPAKALIRQTIRIFPLTILDSYKTTLTNINICFKHLSVAEKELLARNSIIETICSLYETFYALSRSTKTISKNIKRIDNKYLLASNIRANNGLIISGIHNRSVDVALQWVNGQTPTVGLYKPPKIKLLDVYVKKHREQNNNKVFTTSFKGVKELFKAIKKNEIVIMASDQVPKDGMGEYAKFFNREAYTTTLITSLANKTSKPLIYIGLLGTRDNEIKIVFKDAPKIKTVESMNSTMAEIIKINPQDYSWEYKRFKKPPKGLEDPYKN